MGEKELCVSRGLTPVFAENSSFADVKSSARLYISELADLRIDGIHDAQGNSNGETCQSSWSSPSKTQGVNG